VILSHQLPPAIERQGLRIEEAAHALGCGRTTVFKLIREGRLRVVKLGTRTVIPRNEIERILGATGSDAA
jgi:excisionase family DNA binding protein